MLIFLKDSVWKIFFSEKRTTKSKSSEAEQLSNLRIVLGEEVGFIGSTIIVLLYILFAMRGLWIARRSVDAFSGLLAAGLVILITLQSFMNIASITGLFPLTGVPLVFMSQGGTSLLISMAAVGIILGISRDRKV